MQKTVLVNDMNWSGNKIWTRLDDNKNLRMPLSNMLDPKYMMLPPLDAKENKTINLRSVV